MPAKITGCGVDVSTASAAGVLGSRALLRIPKATNKWFTSGCFGFNPKELQLSWESFHRLETSSGTNPKTYWISFFFFFAVNHKFISNYEIKLDMEMETSFICILIFEAFLFFLCLFYFYFCCATIFF